MSWQQPPPLSSQPYATRLSSNPARNEASKSARPQDGLPPRRAYPPMHNASVSPSSSQVYSSPQPPPPPSRRSTHPAAPTHEYGSSFPRQPAPPPSASVSQYQPYPSGSQPPMTRRAETMPMPAHQTITPSMSYDMSHHPPSRSEMSRWPQPSSQSGSYFDVDEGEDDSSDPDGEDLEQSPESMSDLQKRSQASFPFASRKSHGRRPGKGSPGGSPASDQLPCRLCRKLSPRHIIEHWGGFCRETHRTQWMLYQQSS